MTHTLWVPTCHTLHLTYIPSHNFIHQYVSTRQTSFHRPTTTNTILFCVRSKQGSKWRRHTQDGHQGWVPTHLPRAPALSPAQLIKGHLELPFSSHTHFRKPCKLGFQRIALSVRKLGVLLSEIVSIT